MQIGKPLALALGLLTLVPAFYMVLFLLPFFLRRGSRGTETGIPVFGSFDNLMVAHLAVMLLVGALLIFYVVHAFKNERLSTEKRILWVVVLFAGSFVAGIIYWWHYVWKTPPPIPTAQASGSRGVPPGG